MKRYTSIILFFVIAFCITARGQFHPQQTQYMFNAIGVNPGATGQQNMLNATLSHRSMWKGISGAPRTDYLTIHTPLKNEHIAVGFQFAHDKIGVSTKSAYQVSGAYRLPLFNGRLSFGLVTGINTGTNRWSQVETTQADDYVFNTGDLNYVLPSAGAGLYYESRTTFAGLSIPQFLVEKYDGGNKYKTSASPSNFNYHLMAGHRVAISEEFSLLSSFLLKYQKGQSVQPDVTCMLTYLDKADAGITFRNKDAISIIARGKLNPQLRIAYSYDYDVHALARYSGGSHELTLSYSFIYRTKSRDTRML